MSVTPFIFIFPGQPLKKLTKSLYIFTDELLKRNLIVMTLILFSCNLMGPVMLTNHWLSLQHQESTVSQISGFTVVDQAGKKIRARQHTDSITQVTHSNFDISHTLTKNDYFSDINPKSMRRLMNIVAVTGTRILRVKCRLQNLESRIICARLITRNWVPWWWRCCLSYVQSPITC